MMHEAYSEGEATNLPTDDTIYSAEFLSPSTTSFPLSTTTVSSSVCMESNGGGGAGVSPRWWEEEKE